MRATTVKGSTLTSILSQRERKKTSHQTPNRKAAPRTEILTVAYCLLPVALLDHFIRPREQFVRNCNTDLFCRLKVKDEFKPHRLLYW